MNDFNSIIPDLGDIALLCANRTIDKSGTEQDAFTEDTRPDDTQVLSLAATAAREVMSALGIEDVPDALLVDATAVCALRVAQLIELSFYGDTNSASAATLAATYLAGLETLADRLHWSPVRL